MIGQSSGNKLTDLAALDVGSTLLVGGKEVLLEDQLSSQECLTPPTVIPTDAPTPTFRSPASNSAPTAFKSPANISTTAAIRSPANSSGTAAFRPHASTSASPAFRPPATAGASGTSPGAHAKSGNIPNFSKSRRVATSRCDPNAPGALVMPRPNSSQQVIRLGVLQIELHT